MKEYVIQLRKTNKVTKKKEIYVLGLDEEDNETLLLKDTDTSGGKKTLVFKFAWIAQKYIPILSERYRDKENQNEWKVIKKESESYKFFSAYPSCYFSLPIK